jgi:hypothetical protein
LPKSTPDLLSQSAGPKIANKRSNSGINLNEIELEEI